MAIVAMKCPECHGDIQLDDTREFGFCVYCGTKIMIERNNKLVIDETDSIPKWLSMAENALQSKFYEEAYKFSVRITDADPDNLRGWQIRFQSTTDSRECNYCKSQIESLGGDSNLPKRLASKYRRRVLFTFPEEFKSTQYGLKINGHDIIFRSKSLKYEIELMEGVYQIEVRYYISNTIFKVKIARINHTLELYDDTIVRTVKTDDGYAIVEGPEL